MTPLLLVLAMMAAACTAPPTADAPDPATVIAAYAAAWQRGDSVAASVVTTEPAVAAQALDRVATDLQADELTVTPGTVDNSQLTSTGTVTMPVDVSWELEDAGTWTYQVQWTWSLRNGEWKLNWLPANIHPDLGPQQGLVVRVTKATDGSLVDRDDNQVISPIRVYSVVAFRDKITDIPGTAANLAKILTPIEPSLKEAEISAQITAAEPNVGYTVINLRDDAYQRVADQLAAIAGVSTPSEIRNLPVTKDFAKSVLGQVTPVADELIKGTKGWRIVTLDSTGAELAILAEQPAVPGQKVTLTLDTKIQRAAEAALAKITEPATIVAIEPSTGEILTVAQNTPANALGTIAMSGQYPPGSIFKIITATAGIDGAGLRLKSQVACPGRWVIDSRPITNSHEFDLGTVDFTTAFAKSCNTTFAQVASSLPADALNGAAKEYGVGLDFDIKGVISLTGQSPVAETVVQAAEDGFGQGVTLVTPFSAALMAATVANGSMPTPVLLRDNTTTINEPVPPRSEAAKSSLPVMMRAVTAIGTGTQLQEFGEIFLKTGTAEYTNEEGEIRAHAWTIGYVGDLAFAALIVGGDDSIYTNYLVYDFLVGAVGV